MFSLSPQSSFPSRLTAVLGIAPVVFLNVLAASPRLHARLHGQEPTPEHAAHDRAPVGDSDHECAVTLFAHGVTALLLFCLLLLSRLLARGTVLHVRDWLIAARPRYWLMPSHAPPAGLIETVVFRAPRCPWCVFFDPCPALLVRANLCLIQT